MGNSNPDVAIRLGVIGDNDVKTSFENISDAGDGTSRRLQASFDRAATAATAAADKAVQAGQRVAAAMNIGNSNVQLGATANLPSTKEYLAYQAQQERQAEALRNAIEPLRVAQAAYDRELEVANSLLRSGNINQAEYARAVTLATSTFDRAKQSLNGVDSAHKGVSASGQIMQHVFRSTGDSIAAGLPLTMVFGEQIGRLGEAAALSGGKFAGLGAFLTTPWGAALTIGVAVLSPFVAKLFETSEAAKEAAKQLKAFEERQSDMGRFIDANTGKLNEQYRILALIGKVQLPAQIAVQAGTTQGFVNQAFAAARGAIGGQTDNSSMGLGKNRDDLQAVIDGAGGNVQKLRRGLEQLAKTNPSLRAVADQVGGLAGEAAEAAMQIAKLQGRQADFNTLLHGGAIVTTDMIDRQVKLATATTGVEKAQARLNDVTARKATIDAMTSGADKTNELNKYKADLTAATDAVKAAEAAQKALTKSRSAAAAEAKRDAAAEAKFRAELIRSTLNADVKGLSATISKDSSAQWADVLKELEGNQKGRLQPASFAVNEDAAQRSQLAYSQLELTTVGLTADKRQLILDTFLKTQDLQRAGIDAESELGQQILAGVAAQDAMNASLAKSATAMQEVRDFGSQLVDDLAKGTLHAKDLVTEFIKLAALNPIKNFINGNSALPTLTSALGAIGSLFGGKSLSGLGNTALSSGGFAVAGGIGANAAGTRSWRGGLTWVNENGGEIADLPGGTRIYPAAESRRMMQASSSQAETHNHFHLEGAVATQDLLDQMNAIGAAAAAQGAQGGSTLAVSSLQLRASRRMR